MEEVDDEDEASFGESDDKDDDEDEARETFEVVACSVGGKLVEISMAEESSFLLVTKEQVESVIWMSEEVAQLFSSGSATASVDSVASVWVCSFILSSKVRLAFMDESVSKWTVGGSGLGMGFSTGLVRPSFISWTYFVWKKKNI